MENRGQTSLQGKYATDKSCVVRVEIPIRKKSFHKESKHWCRSSSKVDHLQSRFLEILKMEMSCDQPYLGWPSLVRRLDQMTFWDLCQPKLLHDSSHHIHRNNQIGLLFLVAFFLVIVHISLWNSYSIHYNPNIFLFFYSKLDYSLKIFRFAVSSILFCQSLQDLSYLQHLKKKCFLWF